MENQYLDNMNEALKQWVDERVISKEHLRALVLFNEYLVNFAAADGWVYDGHSLQVGVPMTRLIVRGSIDGIPHVVFSSGRTTAGCMLAFLRKLDEGWLEWQVDRFRT